MPAFLYGWSLLLVIQSGGMAAVAITFARYFGELTAAVRLPTASSPSRCSRCSPLINCLGVRAGSNVQSALMVLKIGAIAALVARGPAGSLRRARCSRRRRTPASVVDARRRSARR